jgi:hypothetical protein
MTCGHGLADCWVDGQVRFGYLDILLEMEKGQLEFGKLLLCDGNAHLSFPAFLRSSETFLQGLL